MLTSTRSSKKTHRTESGNPQNGVLLLGYNNHVRMVSNVSRVPVCNNRVWLQLLRGELNKKNYFFPSPIAPENCCCFSHSAHWLPTRKKLLSTVVNPARGLLNREKKKKKVWPTMDQFLRASLFPHPLYWYNSGHVSSSCSKFM